MTFWTFGREGGTRRGGRLRFVAAFCAVLMLIGALGMQAMAAPPLGEVAYPWSENHPLITVEGNAVMTKSGQLTGFFELALKVQTVRYYTDSTYSTEITKQQYIDGGAIGAKREHRFLSAAAALRFNTDLLTPVAWWVASVPYTGANPAPDSYDDGVIDVAGSFMSLSPPLQEFHQISMDTQKADGNISASATISNYNDTEKSALLSLWAEAGNSANGGVMFDDSTAVVVVRFAYNKTAYAEEMKTGAHSPYLMRNADAAVALLTTNTPNSAVWFAADNQLVYSDNSQSIWYTGTPSNAPIAVDDEKTAFYYTAIDSSSVTNVPDPADTGDPVTKFIPKPNTSGWTALSKKIGPPLEYSYLQHMLKVTVGTTPAAAGPNDEVIFTHVNKPSHLTTGINADNMLTILFYDWDDTLIGTRVVERGDVREDVNSYIESTFIHPDLRASDPANAGNPNYTDSLARQYSYRGEFDSSPGSGAGMVTDGEDFPLTNKLDYVFYKRVTTMSEDTVAVAPDFERYWSTEPVSAAAPGDPTFPYVHGWAVIDNMKNIENVWTTFGVGELLDADPAASTPLPPTAAVPGGPTDYAFMTSSADETGYFRLADFADLDNTTAYPGPFLAVKAVYEPGTSLAAGTSYKQTRDPSYARYSTTPSTGGGSYSIQLAYSRHDELLRGYIVGVSRIRKPAVRAITTADVMSKGLTNDTSETFNVRIAVENNDTVDVDIIVAAGVYDVDYVLVDEYGSNVSDGQDRSGYKDDQPVKALTNFAYTEAANAYTVRLGTEGFVFEATLNTLLEQASKSYFLEDNKYTAHTNMVDTFKDINLRDAAGGDLTYSSGRSWITNAVTDALANHATDPDYVNQSTGYADLTYHQVQYFVIDGGTGLRPRSCDADPISWCRVHATCLAASSGKPETLADLLTMLVAAVGGDSVKETTLRDMTPGEFSNDVFWLRKDANGAAFGTINEAVNLLLKLPNAAGFNTSITWEQVQGWVIAQTGAGNPAAPVAVPASPSASDNVAYWWYLGGAKVSDWNSMIAAARKANDPGGTDYALNSAKAAWSSLSMTLMDNDGSDGPLVIAGYDTFKTLLKSAVAAFPAATYPTVSWDQIQAYIMNEGALDDAAAKVISYAEYWWYNNGVELDDTTTLAQLLSAAAAARTSAGGRSAALRSLTLTNLYVNSNYGFAKNFQGESFLTALDFQNAIIRVAEISNGSTTLTWNRVQHAILRMVYNPTDPAYTAVIDDIAAGTESNAYYWWHNPAAITPIAFPVSTGTLDSLMRALIDATYRSVVVSNDYADAWDNLTDGDVAALINKVRLIDDYSDPAGDFADQTHFTTVAGLKAAMESWMADMIGLQAPKAVPDKPIWNITAGVTWEEIQYYLIIGTLGAPASADDYWWKETSTNPAGAVAPDVLYQGLLDLMYDVMLNPWDAVKMGDLYSFLTVDTVKALGLSDFDNAVEYTQADVDSWFEAGGQMEYMLWDDGGGGPGLLTMYDTGSALDLSWYSLQKALAWWWSDDPATDETDLNSSGVFAPTWWATFTPASAPALLPGQMSLIGWSQGENVILPEGGAATVTNTVTTMEDGVVVIRTTTVATTPIETGVVTVTVVTTTKVYADGRTQTTVETETEIIDNSEEIIVAESALPTDGTESAEDEETETEIIDNSEEIIVEESALPTDGNLCAVEETGGSFSGDMVNLVDKDHKVEGQGIPQVVDSTMENRVLLRDKGGRSRAFDLGKREVIIRNRLRRAFVIQKGEAAVADYIISITPDALRPHPAFGANCVWRITRIIS